MLLFLNENVQVEKVPQKAAQPWFFQNIISFFRLTFEFILEFKP